MADYEVLAPGGHAHLVSDVKSYADRAGGKGTTQLADGSVTRDKLADGVTDRIDAMRDRCDPLVGNYFFNELAEGTVLTADDVYAAPPKGVGVYGKSTQAGTPTPDAPVPIKSVDDLTLHVVSGPIRVWNQLMYNGDFANGSDGWGKNPNASITAANGEATVTHTVGGSWASLNPVSMTPIVNGHKYYGSFEVKGICPNVRMNLYSGNTGLYVVASTTSAATNNFTRVSGVYTTPTNPDTQPNGAFITDTPGAAGRVVGDYFTVRNVMFIDLTLMFGAGNEPSTAAEVEALLPNSYYAYDTGTPNDYTNWPVQIPLSNHIARSLPDGTRDTLTLTYIGPSMREGWGVFGAELVQNVLKANLGAASWIVGNLLNDGTGRVFRSSSIDPNAIAELAACMCDHLTMKRANVSWENMTAGEGLFVSRMLVIAWPDADATTTEVKNAVSDYEFLYGTTVPITTQLDPIELPILPNPLTAWADGGSAQPTVSMGYEQDINIVIARLEAAIADLATA